MADVYTRRFVFGLGLFFAFDLILSKSEPASLNFNETDERSFRIALVAIHHTRQWGRSPA